MFVISLFVPPKMATAGIESTWGKYGDFFNSFHSDVKDLTGLTIKLAEAKCQFNFIKHYIYIYIYIFELE